MMSWRVDVEHMGQLSKTLTGAFRSLVPVFTTNHVPWKGRVSKGKESTPRPRWGIAFRFATAPRMTEAECIAVYEDNEPDPNVGYCGLCRRRCICM